ncbi:MAG: helix-turn-helix domain-containing protein [Planctomycetes bacterium]|nr:helix-turn-helix domain-containing protein [Planctomycetota bacterium]
MELTIREAAPLLGRSTRAVRAWIARGQLPAHKRGNTWWIRSEDLPLTHHQRTGIQARADQVRQIVDDALPSRAARTRDRRSRSVVDLHAFRAGQELLRELAALEPTETRTQTARAIRAALLDLGAGTYEFDRATRAASFRRARRRLARTICRLVLAEQGAPELHVCARIENDMLPPIGGLLRWAETPRRKGAWSGRNP